MIRIIDIVNHEIENLVCEKDELAYLSMTGKVENFIRDKISFALHKQLIGTHLVLREWKAAGILDRTDIAVLDLNEKLVCLIELKARVLPGVGKEFISSMKKDIDKMNAKSFSAEKISIVIFTNFAGTELKSIENVKKMKYYKKLNGKMVKLFLEKISNDIAKIQSNCNLKISKQHAIKSGHYLGNEIENLVCTFTSNEK